MSGRVRDALVRSARRVARTVTTSPPSPGFAGPGHTAVMVVDPAEFAANDPFIVLMDDRLELARGAHVGGEHPHAGFEIASGLLVALGFLGPIGPALMISVMIVAMATVHWKNGMFATQNGIELPFLYAAAGLALGLTGFGRYSLDAILGLTPLFAPAVAYAALEVGIVGGLGSLAVRRVVQ